MLSVSPTPLVVEKGLVVLNFLFAMFGFGAKIELMTDLQHQGIAVDNGNDPVPKNIPDEVPNPEDGYSWISEGIIFPRLSKHLHNTYAAFRNYSREEVMKMTKLELFLILSPVDYLK